MLIDCNEVTKSIRYCNSWTIYYLIYYSFIYVPLEFIHKLLPFCSFVLFVTTKNILFDMILYIESTINKQTYNTMIQI